MTKKKPDVWVPRCVYVYIYIYIYVSDTLSKNLCTVCMTQADHHSKVSVTARPPPQGDWRAEASRLKIFGSVGMTLP